MLDAQVLLNTLNIAISAVAIYLWITAARIPALRVAAWWPIALLVNNLLYSLVLILDVLLIISIPGEVLVYWSQAVRLQLGITLVYGVLAMRELRRNVNK